MKAGSAGPPGLSALCTSVGFERASYFGLQSLLALYLADTLIDGRSVAGIWLLPELASVTGTRDVALASVVTGLFVSLAALAPVIGGLVADRITGQRRAILIGGVMMAAGHGLLAFEPALLPALVAIALGAGFFKGPAAAQLSALYAPLDAARVEGFRLFYIAINLAGLLAPLIIGTVGERVHWHAGFAMSCLGMLTGLAIYRWRFAGPGLKEPGSDGADSVPPPLARGDAAILSILGVSTALLVVPNFQITNAYLLWVDRSFDLSLFGWRMPSSWIIAVDGALSLAALYGSLLFWRSWDHALGTSPPLRKAMAGAVVVVAGSLCLALAARLHGETPVPIGWGLAFQLLNSIGLANVLPAVMALFGQFSTRRYAATSMTMFYLSLFAGGLTSTALASQYAVLGPLLFWLLHSGAAAAGMGGLIIVMVWERKTLTLQYAGRPFHLPASRREGCG